jgi:hypothetical protein
MGVYHRAAQAEFIHGAVHALALADAALAAHLDLKDRLAVRFVFNDCHVPKLKAQRLIEQRKSFATLSANPEVAMFRPTIEFRAVARLYDVKGPHRRNESALFLAVMRIVF